MLKEYNLSDFLLLPTKHIEYYAGILEAMKKQEIECPYRQSFYSVVWLIQGEGLHVIDFKEHKIRKGRMFLVNPNQIINWSYTHNCKGYILMFEKTLASHLGIEFLEPYIDIEKKDVALLKLVFENLIKDCTLNDNDLQYKIMTSIQYFYSLIAHKIHDEATTSENGAVFRQFRKLILTDDLKHESMEKYADMLQISASELNSICQNLSGTSSKQFLLDLKLTEAKRLLLYSRLNITEISTQLGFEDSSYFARLFRKKVCLSPSLFQEKYRK
jgi:AraC-like DNA-binding protein